MGKPVKNIKFVNAHYHDEQKDYHLFFEPYQINKNVVLSPKVLKCIDASAIVAKLTSNQQFQAVVKVRNCLRRKFFATLGLNFRLRPAIVLFMQFCDQLKAGHGCFDN